jgi:hypothetical protein
MHQNCTRVGAILMMQRSFSHISRGSVQTPLVFEVEHGDLNTRLYTPYQTCVLYIEGQKCIMIALALKPS